MLNLDLECAKTSDQIKTFILSADAKMKKDAENLIGKVLGVLQEDGIYAFFLYMQAKKTQKIYETIEEHVKHLLKTAFPSLDITQNGCKVAETLMSDLDRVLLAKDLLERTLVYARYHAKPLGGE
jgi:hypothetical protein